MEVYTNKKQKEFLNSTATRKTFIAGRGAGKTRTLGLQKVLCFNYMPRGKGLLAGLTYGQILNNTLPECIDAWRACGIEEYDPQTNTGHFVVGKKPPAHFELAYQAPRKYNNVVSFINGYCTVLGSLDIADTLRGASYDDMQVDESALVKQDDFNKILVPMVRGNPYRSFCKYPVYGSICDFSSMPWLQSGHWVFRTEELMKKNPEEYFYIEASSQDNAEVLGDKWFKNMANILSPLEYAVEIQNKRVKRLPNCFYPSFNENVHCDFKTYQYDYTDEGITVGGYSDYHAKQSMDISLDFNAKFNSMIVGQMDSQHYRIINEFYLADYQTIDALVDKFCSYYSKHQYKYINMYGDRNGNNRVANSELTFYEQIIIRFKMNGWTCVNHVSGLDADHKTKHFYLNTLLSETDKTKPIIRINANTCKYLIISIQNSPITADFKKDKKSENTSIDQRYATHLSDCFDNLIYKKFGNSSQQISEIDFF
jgi:hypothetical protein